MIDPSLRSKAEHVAQIAAARAKKENLVEWVNRLKAVGESPKLKERLEQVNSLRWAGALPTWEPTDSALGSSSLLSEVVGIDGSQIYPPDRSPVLWAYIQTVAYRKLCQPVLVSRFFDFEQELALGIDVDEEVPEYYEYPQQIKEQINTWRTLLEMQLASQTHQKNPDCVVLFDNGLLPWFNVRGQTPHEQMQAYLYDLLMIKPGLIAGVLSGAQSRLLSRLILLAEAETLDEGLKRRSSPLDITIMAQLLSVGERSALFKHGSPRNKLFEKAGAGVYFFFLRVNRTEIARIEVPEWIAKDPCMVDAVHSAVFADSKATGYSYVLSMAHQQVLVSLDVAETIQNGVLARYWKEVGQVMPGNAKMLMKLG